MPTPTNAKPTENGTLEKLLLTADEAAQQLSICPKSLWSLTAPRGPIKSIRLGRSVRYSLTTLREFIAQQSQA